MEKRWNYSKLYLTTGNYSLLQIFLLGFGSILNKLSTGIFLKSKSCHVCTGSEIGAECLFTILSFLIFFGETVQSVGTEMSEFIQPDIIFYARRLFLQILSKFFER